MAIVSMWQGWMLRQATRDPFVANLQSKQIDYCADYLASAADLRSDFLLYGQWSRKENLPFGIVLDLDRLRFDVRASSLELSTAGEKLGLLATDPIKKALDSESSARTAFTQILDASEPTTRGNDDLWVAQFDDGVGKIRDRCSQVMLGSNLGML